MATMMRTSSGASATPSRWPDSQQQQHLPPLPPPANVGSSSTSRMGGYEKASWDKNRDQDLEREHRERERDWDRNYASGSSGRGGGGRYHDPDERYGSHHRREGGSQGYGRSTDEWRR